MPASLLNTKCFCTVVFGFGSALSLALLSALSLALLLHGLDVQDLHHKGGLDGLEVLSDSHPRLTFF